MASGAVRTSFESCLSNTESRFVTPIVKFRNHVARYFATSEGRDKALKFADALLDTIHEIAETSGASDETVRGIGRGRALVKTGRDAYAIFNIFAGVISALVANVQNVGALARELCVELYTGHGDDVLLKDPEREKFLNPGSLKYKGKPGEPYVFGAKEVSYLPNAPHNAVAKGKAEKFLALGANLGKGTAAASYIWSFAVPRVIQNLEKHVGLKFNETVHQVGQTFASAMIANHIGGMFGNGCEFGFQYLAYKRTEAGDGEAYKEYRKKTIEAMVGFTEKSLEFVQDIANFTQVAAPVWFRCPLVILIGCFSCYKEWLKTE